MLVVLQYEASFKLTQIQKETEVQKFIEISACQSAGAHKDKDLQLVRSYVEVNTIFNQALYPEVIEEKQAGFMLESQVANFILQKFVNRFENLPDERVGTIKFTQTES